MKLSSLLFEQWHLFPALTLCKLCYHIYHTERMTTATASSVGRRPPPQEPKCTRWCWGRRACPLLSHLDPGLSQKAAKPKQHTGCGAGLCCPSAFLFPGSAGCLWVQQDMTRVLPPERGEESWPEARLSPVVPLQRGWQAKEAAAFLSPSRLKSTAASLKHGFVVRDAALALPPSQGIRRTADFCSAKIFPSNLYLLLCWQGLLVQKLPATALSPACPSLLGM